MSGPGADERQALLAEWRRQAAEPLPADLRSSGCALAIVGVAGMVAAPVVARWLALDLPRAVRLGILVAGGAVTLGGLLLNLLGGTKRATASHARVETALAVLASRTADPAARRAAAVSLLLGAYDSTGPGTRVQYEAEEMRDRLGPALGEVCEVERSLAEDLPGFWRVFTRDGTEGAS